MALPRDRERVRQVLSDTIGLLCKNGLSFNVELSVDALIGITIDRQEVFLVSIKDTYNSERNLQEVNNGSCITPSVAVCEPGIRESDSHQTKSSYLFNCGFTPSGLTPHEDCVTIGNESSDNLTVLQARRKRLSEKHELQDELVKKSRISDERKKHIVENTDIPVAIKLEPCDDISGVETMTCTQSKESDARLEYGISNLQTEANGISYAGDCGEQMHGDCYGRTLKEGKSVVILNRETNENLENSPFLSLDRHEKHSDCLNGNNGQYEGQISPSTSPKQCSEDFHSIRQTGALPVCPVGISTFKKQTVLKASCTRFMSDDRLDRIGSHTSRNQRGNFTLSESLLESASSDSEVICIKEEIQYLPSNHQSPSMCMRAGTSHLQPKNASLDEAVFAVSPLEGLNLESLSYEDPSAWNDNPKSLSQVARRQRKGRTHSWSQENMIVSNTEEKILTENQMKFAIQSILLYDGQYVPLRDIQRLRLCGMAAGQIKLAMEHLTSHGGKLGCFQVLHGGVNLFYKCPPNLVDRKSLESYFGIPWDTYKFHYDVTPAANYTNKHNEQYWLKVASSSPYDPLNSASTI